MNILFIHASNIVVPSTSGIIRVTATLKRIFEEHGHRCYNAYYKEVPGAGKPAFSDSLKLTRDTEVPLLTQACNKWDVDIIICQIHPAAETLHLLQSIKKCSESAAQGTGLKKKPRVIECYHNNPYIEVLGYTPNYLWYLLTEAKFSLPQRLKKVLWGMYCCYLPQQARQKIARRYQRIFDLTDKVVLLSEKFMPEMQQYQHFSPGQLQYANNPMTYNTDFKADELKNKEKLVVFVGRLDESQKRLSESLKIWKQIEQDPCMADWRYDIVGRGCDADYYQRMTARLKLQRVTFCGEQDPKAWYSRASILMLTSAYEGWGMVINEAQQKGAIPVAYDSYASVRDLITDGVDGCIVPNLNRQAYVDRLKALMTDADLRLMLQNHCLQNSGRSTEDVIYSQWEKVLQS